MRSLLAKIWKALHLPKDVQLFIMRWREDLFLVGVTGIILNEKNEVLLFKHTYRGHAWSLPGGYMKAGEHPREALEREIKEESNFTVSVDESIKTRTDRTGSRLDICCRGTFIGGEFTPSAEVSEYGFFAQDNLPLVRKSQLFFIDAVLKTTRHS